VTGVPGGRPFAAAGRTAVGQAEYVVELTAESTSVLSFGT
jgi:hypothetical protein